MAKKKKKITVTHPGRLHELLNVAPGKDIPEWKLQKALDGDYGKEAAHDARYFKYVLTGGHK